MERAAEEQSKKSDVAAMWNKRDSSHRSSRFHNHHVLCPRVSQVAILPNEERLTHCAFELELARMLLFVSVAIFSRAEASVTGRALVWFVVLLLVHPTKDVSTCTDMGIAAYFRSHGRRKHLLQKAHWWVVAAPELAASSPARLSYADGGVLYGSDMVA